MRQRARLFQQLCRAVRPCQPRYFALRIVEIAENHGLWRARLHARGCEFPILQRTLFRLRLNFGRFDALHAECAFLHHANAAYRNIWIQLQIERLVPHGIEPVEKPYIVGAGVCAIPSTDAAIVDLPVQPLGRVIARKRGAYRLARSFTALLAKHGHKLRGHVGKIALVISLDANPVLRAAARRLFFPNRADIVLGMARHDASFAARAAVQIDHHSPLPRHQLFLSNWPIMSRMPSSFRVCASSTIVPLEARLFSPFVFIPSERSEGSLLAAPGMLVSVYSHHGVLPALLLILCLAQTPAEEDQLPFSGFRNLHARRAPSQCAVLSRQRRENRYRIRPASTCKSREMVVPLPHWYRNRIGSNRGRDHRRRTHTPVLRSHLNQIRLPDPQLLRRHRINFHPTSPHRARHGV